MCDLLVYFRLKQPLEEVQPSSAKTLKIGVGAKTSGSLEGMYFPSFS